MSEYQYEEIREVRNFGYRRANRLLDHGWVLLDWRDEQYIEKRDVRQPDGTTEVMHFKTQRISYILGRSAANSYTCDVMMADEKREADEKRQATGRREARRAEELAQEDRDNPLDNDGNVVIPNGAEPSS